MAASALAQTAGTPAASGRSGFKTMELDHVSYQVNDYCVTRDFYADLMGMEVRNDNAINQCELWFGKSVLLDRNHFGPQRSHAPRTSQNSAVGGSGRQITSVVDHISYRIQSWNTEEVKAEYNPSQARHERFTSRYQRRSELFQLSRRRP